MRYLRHRGQSLVEFALILPIFVLIIIGIFDLGRAFFAYIAISNAAREGARVVTFWPGKTTQTDVDTAVYNEIGDDTVVDPGNIDAIIIQCIDPDTNALRNVDGTFTPADCAEDNPVHVTVRYTHHLILSFLFGDSLTLERTIEMMVP